MEDAYLVVATVMGWRAYRALDAGRELAFGSEQEMRLSLSAMGYEYASGDGIMVAQTWRRDAT